MAKLKDKVVIITGGGQGIGLGVAKAFAEEGAKLCITGRNLDKLERAAAELKAQYGTEVLCVTADGSKEEDVKAAVKKAGEHFGKIDCVVNNAQTSKSGLTLIEHSKEDFDLAIYTGLYATFYYMREAFPYLKESKGCVINFASGAGLHGRPGQSSYAAAKEGIRGLSRTAATEWGDYGIRVNVVCPLAMTPGLAKWKEEYPEMYEKQIQAIPLKRFADAQQDIGKVCVFLASDDAGYITGQTIELQGGSALRP